MIVCPSCGEFQNISQLDVGKFICDNCHTEFHAFAGGSGGNSNSSKFYFSPVEIDNELAVQRLENIFLESTDFVDRAAIRYAIETLKQIRKI